MAQMFFSDYIMWHETTRYSPTAGEAPPTSYPALERGENSVGCSSGDVRLEEFRRTLARCLQSAWHTRTAPKADSWETSAHVGCPKGATGNVASEGPLGSRILDRPLDAEPNCRTHKETVSYQLSPEPCMAFIAEHGLELSEAGAPCLATGRTRDCSLETGSLVRDKKKPPDVVPTWCFWMKAASCLSPMSNAHGRPEGRHHISTIGSAKTEYRPLPPSVFLRSTDGRLSTSDFINATSRDSTSKTSFDIYSSIYEDLLSCCGIAARSTVIDEYKRIANDTRESKLSSSRLTHRSSTQQNSSGVKPIQPSRTLRHGTFQTSTCISGLLQPNWADHNLFSDRVFTHRVCRGKEPDTFLYLCETQ